MKEDRSKRFIDVVAELIELGVFDNATKAATKLGLTKQQLSDIKAGTRPLPVSAIDIIIRDYNGHRAYIYEGTLPKVTKQLAKKISDLTTVNESVADYITENNGSDFQFKPIPFYNINVSAGNTIALDQGIIHGQKPDGIMYVPNDLDVDIAFPTFGESMSPEIKSGDRVAYKFMKDFKHYINFGLKYMVVTNEQRMLKYVKRHTKKSMVLLESANEKFDAFEIAIDDIKYLLQARYIERREM